MRTFLTVAFAIIISFCANAIPTISSPLFDEAAPTISSILNTKTILIEMGKIENDALVIQIEDAKGNVLLKEKVSNVKSFSKRYNLNQLPDGDYTINMERKLRSTSQPFSINDNVLTLDESLQVNHYRPAFVDKDNKVDVNLLLNNYVDVSIVLLDADRDEVYRDEIKHTLVLHKRYNFEKLDAGNYELKIITPNDVFYHTFEINKN